MAGQSKNSRVQKTKSDIKIYIGTSKEMVVPCEKTIDKIVTRRGFEWKLNVVAKDGNELYFTNSEWVGKDVMDPWRQEKILLSDDEIEYYGINQ